MSHDQPQAPEGYDDGTEEGSPLAEMEGFEELQPLLENEETGFSSRLFLGQDGELVLGVAGTKDGKDIKNDLELARGEVPDQARDYLEAYSGVERFAEANGLSEPVGVGHSLGGFLTQLGTRGVSFNTPAAGLAREQLVEEGAYTRAGLPEQAEEMVHLGLDSDAVYNFEPGGVPHVSGREGGRFHLYDSGSGHPALDLTSHTDWDSLATSQNVSDVDKGMEYALERTFGLLPDEGAPPGTMLEYRLQL